MEGADRTQRHSISAILAVDIVGSTDLRHELGGERAARLHQRTDQIMSADTETHGGRVVRLTGDGIIASFGSVTAALAAAHRIRSDLADSSVDHVPVEISIRAVIDVGDVDWTGAEPVGTVLDNAVEMVDAFDGSGIICTEIAAVLAQRSSAFDTEPGPIDGTVVPMIASD